MRKKYTATEWPSRKGKIFEIEKRKHYIALWRELSKEAVTDLSQDRMSEWMLFQTCSLIQTSLSSHHVYAYAYGKDDHNQEKRITVFLA
jgi:competence protein ComGF